MSDPRKKTTAAQAASRKRTEMAGLGIVFALTGLALTLTMDSPAIGLPFIVLGVVFFGMGFSPKKKTSGAAKPPTPQKDTD